MSSVLEILRYCLGIKPIARLGGMVVNRIGIELFSLSKHFLHRRCNINAKNIVYLTPLFEFFFYLNFIFNDGSIVFILPTIGPYHLTICHLFGWKQGNNQDTAHILCLV